jgi:hypothetical protein
VYRKKDITRSRRLIQKGVRWKSTPGQKREKELKHARSSARNNRAQKKDFEDLVINFVSSEFNTLQHINHAGKPNDYALCTPLRPDDDGL